MKMFQNLNKDVVQPTCFKACVPHISHVILTCFHYNLCGFSVRLLYLHIWSIYINGKGNPNPT